MMRCVCQKLFGRACLTFALLIGASGLRAEVARDPMLSWGYNSFGVSGLIDMPGAYSQEDGELGFSVSHFRNQTRISLSFQISDRISASFRYSMLDHVRADPGGTINAELFDRSFSLHYRFMDEGPIRPAIAIGLNDIVGTGVYGGEYVVATKTITPRLRATLGLGWGRLGTVGSFTNPLGVLSDRFKIRPARARGEGGSFQAKTWFRGDAAFFGGLEWLATDRLRLIAEYSSDDYAREDGAAFDRKSPLNFGVSWKASDRVTLNANYLYGSELGVQLTYAFNPRRSRHGGGRESAPQPILPAHAAAAATWGVVDRPAFTNALKTDLAREGIRLEGMRVEGDVLRISIRNTRYGIHAQSVGRAARILSRQAPEEARQFDITLTHQAMPVTRVSLRREDLEEFEFHSVAPDLLRANTVIRDTRDPLESFSDLYPIFSYGIGPYLTPSFFDPDDPLRADLGIALSGRYEPLPGLRFTGKLHQKLVGNLDKGDRPSTSILPHVRSDSYLYYKGGDTTIPELTGAYYFRAGRDLFGRITAGYLESMFGGVSTELLWKPQNSALALGVELNYVRQRDFDQLFGFQDYSVVTGHVSAYYEFGSDYLAQLDVGRYLAGDIGATLTLSREFDNGWKIGVFATKTDVSAEEFGEGSFDKGISLTIPLSWISGQPDQTKLSTTIRPVLRDGGARLNVSDRLYEGIRSVQASELDASWGRFWK